MATPEDFDETVRLVEAAGGRMITSIADVPDRQAVIAPVEQGVAAFGRRANGSDFTFLGVGSGLRKVRTTEVARLGGPATSVVLYQTLLRAA